MYLTLNTEGQYEDDCWQTGRQRFRLWSKVLRGGKGAVTDKERRRTSFCLPLQTTCTQKEGEQRQKAREVREININKQTLFTLFSASSALRNRKSALLLRPCSCCAHDCIASFISESWIPIHGRADGQKITRMEIRISTIITVKWSYFNSFSFSVVLLAIINRISQGNKSCKSVSLWSSPFVAFCL